MKKKPATKKKAAAVQPKTLNVNLAYVSEIIDESIATMMAMRALIHELVAEKEARK